MDEGNMVERMLRKGDRLKYKYDDFDFGQLNKD